MDVADSIVRAAAGAGPDIPLEDIAAVPPILSLLCERLNDRRLAAPEPAACISAADFAPGEASRILGSFYDEKTRSHPRALLDYLEDELVSTTGLRETVTLDSALAALPSVRDAEARMRSLVDDRILVIEERHGIARVEFTHDTLARFALERRTQRHARRRRRRAIAWSSAALVIAGISIGLMLWALRERITARGQTRKADSALANAKAQVQEASRSDTATAQARLAEGKWQEAVAYLGRAIRYDPENRNAQDALWLALRHGQRDADRGQPIGAPLAHKGFVLNASFSPDGTRVVTASFDNTAQVWDANSGQKIGAPLTHKQRVYSASFSPDGTRVVTASFDQTAQVWDAKSGQPIRMEAAEELSAFATGSRLDPRLGTLQQISFEECSQIRGKLLPVLAGLRDWHFIAEQAWPRDPKTALISPRMSMTVREAATRLISTGVPGHIREAAGADPGHPLLPFAYATTEASKSDNQPANPVRAAWLCDYGTKRLPEDLTATDLRTAVRLCLQVSKSLIAETDEEKAAVAKQNAIALLDKAARLEPESEETKALRAELQ